MSSVVKEETRRITLEVNQYRAEKMGRLKNLDLFILDNSIRESTVGQLRSHTVENKKAIFAEVTKWVVTKTRDGTGLRRDVPSRPAY